MAKIQNSQAIQQAVIDLMLDPLIEAIPKETSDKIMLNYPIKLRRQYIQRGGSQTTTGFYTVYTTPNNPNQRFYLTSISASINKNATCDVATGDLDVEATAKNEAANNLLSFPVLTLTAEREVKNIIFPEPLPMERNTPIRFNGTFTAGNLQRAINLTGFILDTTD